MQKFNRWNAAGEFPAGIQDARDTAENTIKQIEDETTRNLCDADLEVAFEAVGMATNFGGMGSFMIEGDRDEKGQGTLKIELTFQR